MVPSGPDGGATGASVEAEAGSAGTLKETFLAVASAPGVGADTGAGGGTVKKPGGEVKVGNGDGNWKKYRRSCRKSYNPG